MSWLISRALGEAFESSLFLQEQGAASSGGTSWGGEQSPQLNVIFTQHPFWLRDKTIGPSGPFPSGVTYAPLTPEDGEVLLTWYLEASLARTSRPLVKGRVSPVRAADYGRTWRELSTRFVQPTSENPSSRSWRTRPSLWDEGLTSFLPTLPRWGSMRSGALWERMTLARPTNETAGGALPTPVKYDSSDWGQKPGNNYHGLGWQAANIWSKTGLVPTPIKADAGYPVGEKSLERVKNGTSMMMLCRAVELDRRAQLIPTPKCTGLGTQRGALMSFRGRVERGELTRDQAEQILGGSLTPPRLAPWTWWDEVGQAAEEEASQSAMEPGSQDGGKLNPMWVEWLMGWPMGWTALQPLETDKFQQWLSAHGITSPTE